MGTFEMSFERDKTFSFVSSSFRSMRAKMEFKIQFFWINTVCLKFIRKNNYQYINKCNNLIIRIDEQVSCQMITLNKNLLKNKYDVEKKFKNKKLA